MKQDDECLINQAQQEVKYIFILVETSLFVETFLFLRLSNYRLRFAIEQGSDLMASPAPTIEI